MASAAATTAGQTRKRTQRGGRGRVLTAALEQVEVFPVLEPARTNLLEAVERGAPDPLIAEAIESDVGLTVAALRTLGQLPGAPAINSVSDVVDAVGQAKLEQAVRDAPGHQPLQRARGPVSDPERFRIHSLTVQRAADAVADASGSADRDGIALISLLHDMGRLVLARLHPGYAERFDRRLASPEERIAAERKELGIDHALVGGVLARRWKLSAAIATSIERHHTDCNGSQATIVRVGDMLAAHLDGDPIEAGVLVKAAASCGVDSNALGALIHELPRAAGRRRRVSAPCPLSARELEVLRGLAKGKVYKQIAYELELSASTVRSHLHNVYGKLGALDRAQAVLMATERGWL